MTAEDDPQKLDPSGNSQAPPRYERSELLARRGSREANYSKSQEDFDKVLLTIATGGLVLSLGFIEKIVNLPTARCTALLVLSWVGFVIGLVAALASHWSATEACLAAINAIDQDLASKPPTEAEKKAEQLRKKTMGINIVSGLSTVVGVVLLVWFAGVNTLSQHNRIAESAAPSCVPIELLSEVAKRYESKTSESERSPNPILGLEEEGWRSTTTSAAASPATSAEVGSVQMAKHTRIDGITPPPPPRPEGAKKGVVPPPPPPRPTTPAPSTKPTVPTK